MDKEPDFGRDLAILNEGVTTEVGDVLQALRQKKTAGRTSVVSPSKAAAMPATVPEADAVNAADATAAPRQPARTANRSRLKPVVERDTVLENVTTRLRRETNELLTEAALRQRLKKTTPATRQDIIETALGDWFRKHGYRLELAGES